MIPDSTHNKIGLIEIRFCCVLTLLCVFSVGCLSLEKFSWDSQQGRDWATSGHNSFIQVNLILMKVWYHQIVLILSYILTYIPEWYIFVLGVDDIVRVWNVSDGELRLKNKLTDHSLGVVAVDINKEATKAVSSSLDSTIHLWDLQSGERIRKIDNGPMESWTVAFSPDGKHIISGAQNGKVHFFDTETGQKEQQMDTRGKFVLSIAYVSLW